MLAAGGAYAAHESYEWYKENQRTADDRAAAHREDLWQDYDAFHASQGQSWLQQNVQALARQDRAIPGVYNPRTDKGKEKLTDSDISLCETTDPVEGWVDPGFTTEPTRIQTLSTPLPELARPIIEGFDEAPVGIDTTRESFDIYEGPQINVLTRDKEKEFSLPKEQISKTYKHDRFGKFYQNKEDGYYYTKDQAKHGGSVWKVYKEKARGLEWISDLDQYGKEMEKHKSDVGKFIPRKELNGAG